MVSIEREVFPALVGQGLICVQSTCYWRDIGTLESFLTANADAIAGRVHTRLGGAADAVLIDPSAQVDPTAVLTAPVQIGAGAVIGAGARLGPDVIVGAGAEVGPRAVLSTTVLLAGAQVAADAEVERSAIGRNALVGERAHVRASALGTDQAASAGEQLVGERRPG
jgi:NDP-sugar pyrophosphorylase family protein